MCNALGLDSGFMKANIKQVYPLSVFPHLLHQNFTDYLLNLYGFIGF